MSEGDDAQRFIVRGRAIDLGPPPRRIGAGARIAALFGGALSQIGWGIFGFTLMFFWVFAADSEAVTFLEFMGGEGTTEGWVTKVRQTGASENDEPIYAASFTYTVDGKEYEATSYGRGAPPEGSTVPITYLSSRPHRARIEGMRVRTFGALAAVVAVFPLGCLAFLFFSVRKGLRHLRLARLGRVGYGRLVGKETTGVEVNEQPQYKLTFEFIVPPAEQFGTYRDKWASWAQTHRFHMKTHELDAVTDEAHEPILYDPDRPGDAVLIDALHPKMRAREQGFDGHSLMVLFLPIVTVTVHAIWLAALVS